MAWLRLERRIGRHILEKGSKIADLGQGDGKLITDLHLVILGVDEDDADTAGMKLLA